MKPDKQKALSTHNLTAKELKKFIGGEFLVSFPFCQRGNLPMPWHVGKIKDITIKDGEVVVEFFWKATDDTMNSTDQINPRWVLKSPEKEIITDRYEMERYGDNTIFFRSHHFPGATILRTASVAEQMHVFDLATPQEH